MDFATRNPLDSAFWDERFDKGFTPWNRGAVPQNLQRYVDTMRRQADGNRPVCLIPGCGHAYELDFLMNSGWQVTAIDFSPSAVATAQALFPRHAAAILQADFFEYQPTSHLECIYERAFFCALPPAMRKDVVAQWAALLPSGGQLIGFFLLDDTEGASKKGPPFRTHPQEFATLMQPYFTCLEDADVNDSLAVFEGKERWQVWQRL